MKFIYNSFHFTFGKYRGKSFADLSFSDLQQYIEWLSRENYLKYKPIIDAFEAYGRKISTSPKRMNPKEIQATEMPEMPDYMKDSNIPFLR